MLSVRHFRRSSVQRTSHADTWLVEHVSVNHRCRDILVTQEFLHGANVLAFREQMGGERMSEAVAIGALHNSGRIHCALQCALQNSFSHVMSLSVSGARINRKARGRKHILPGPLACRVRELAPDREWQVHASESIFDVLFVLCFNSYQVSLQRLGLVQRQHGDAILTAFGVAHCDLRQLEIDVFHPEPYTLHQP